MRLTDFLQDLPDARVVGDAGVWVNSVRDDSRAVEPGDLFVAVRGETVDGHNYADRAVAAGAAVLVVDQELPVQITQVIVPDTAVALGELASRAAGRAADRLQLIALTGTNGKTTCSYLIEAMLTAAGHPTGVIGTVSYRYGGHSHPAEYTTPTPLELHRVLADIEASGCTHAVLETSSAALAMNRLEGVRFCVGAFTNLTQDHLDVHGTMEAYRDAKARLFQRYLTADGTAVAFVDDPAGPHMLQCAGSRRQLAVTTSANPAQVAVHSAESTIEGIRATLQTPRGPLELESHALLGAYNVANIALSTAVGEALGLPHEAIARGIRELPGVPGRVERVPNDHNLDILVDYAHTPDALANALDALRPLTERRLICVFGCGGDRDRGKRPKMGAAVTERADLAVVTSDNPRTEEPMSIIRMILPAVPQPFFVHPDRRTAIRAAVAEATPGDIVLIAGKGHEDYQVLGTEKVHFDDREEAAAATAARESIPMELIAQATGATLLAGDRAPASVTRVVINGREAAPGDLYVAIQGDRFDGHEFCGQALDNGAVALMTTRPVPTAAPLTLQVPDTRIALGQVARAVRRRWAKPLIGITGSTGKTSTKELITAALAPAGCVHRTAGSLNNETGVPLTLLGLRPFHDFAVIEMGMRGLGEIRYLCEVAEPEIGVVINAGVAHVGVVGSIEQIARGKSEIFEALPPGGCAVVPADDPRLATGAASAPRTITFGDSPKADVHLLRYRSCGIDGSELAVRADGAEHTLLLPLVGRHNAINATCAIATALAAGVSVSQAIQGLADARPTPLRSELRRVAGRNLLVDCYNANPTSMAAALESLAELRGDRAAVAVLGDMLELGDTAEQAHQTAGRRASELGFQVIALGEHREALLTGAGRSGHSADDPDQAAAAALAATSEGDWILIKASRGMRLERVVEALGKVGDS